ERVLRNLALGEDFLTDSPRLTRRGYRLPIKVNPLDCKLIATIGKESLKPIGSPIYGPDREQCAYRISANFAMQELEDLGISDPAAKSIREKLAPFASSSEAAFNIEMTATINGVPLRLYELTGERTGNEGCPSVTLRTCIGNYGTIDYPPNNRIPEWFYPKQRAGGTAHGDVFQRITANKRVGRAVAFSNSIMDNTEQARCPQNYPPYHNLGEMEAKQDCLFDVPE